MKKLNCRLIISDFDGTLANSRNTVDGEVVSAIRGFVDDGGVFAVCTGRILPSIMPVAKNLGLKGLVVACQGSVIADIRTGEVIRCVSLPYGRAAEVCSALEERGEAVNAYVGDGYYSSLAEGDEHLRLYEDITGVRARHVNVPLSEHIRKNRLACQKIASLCYPEDREALYEEMRGRFGSVTEVTCSAKVLVEISPQGETKGAAVKFLADYYGIPKELTCAVGDNLNDLSMIEEAGIGVAVGNASEELKRKAQFVTVTNDEGAVARVIEEFGYFK